MALTCLLLAGCGSDGVTGPFERPPLTDLPADLADLTFTVEGRPSAPYIMLELQRPQGFLGFVILNREGRPVWYYRTQGAPLGFTVRNNGNFVLLDTERGLLEVNADGQVLRELAQQPRPGRFMHHDVVASPTNSVLFLAEERRDVNGTEIVGEAIWEWRPEIGSTQMRWNSFDHLDPELDWGPRSVPTDWLHANALGVGPRGNTTMSLHFLDQVISIAADYSLLEWRLGGTRATVPVDDPFSGQHTAMEISQDRVLLFDNGYAREQERYSRAAEYQLNVSGGIKVWQWRPQRDNWSRIISSARRLPNENTVVAFGAPVNVPPGSTGPLEVYEVTLSGTVVWHLTVDSRVSAMYRATPLFDF